MAATSVQAAPGGQQRLLHQVLGIGQRTEHPVTVQPQFADVRRDEFPESLFVPRSRPVKRGSAHRHMVPCRWQRSVRRAGGVLTIITDHPEEHQS
jgi:hypothetical protein